MESFMVGLDVRPDGRTRASILEPAYDMTVETFSFHTARPSALERRLAAWLDVYPIDFEIAICVDDEWPYNLELHLPQTIRIRRFHGGRVDDVGRRAESILGCRLRRHRSQLMAFMTKYDMLDPPPADVARKWAVRMAREFLFCAFFEARPDNGVFGLSQAAGRPPSFLETARQEVTCPRFSP